MKTPVLIGKLIVKDSGHTTGSTEYDILVLHTYTKTYLLEVVRLVSICGKTKLNFEMHKSISGVTGEKVVRWN